MPIYKRDPELDKDYRISGNTVLKPSNRSSGASERNEREARRVPDNRSAYFGGSAAKKQEQQPELGFGRHRGAAAPGDTRGSHERRRAEPPRAHIATGRDVTREGLNQELAKKHYERKKEAELEKKRQEQEEKERIERQREADEQQEALNKGRAVRISRVIAISVCVVCVAVTTFVLLDGETEMYRLLKVQRELESQIEKKTQMIEELEVKINKQSNLMEIQDYARDYLEMDYATGTQTRKITLPEG